MPKTSALDHSATLPILFNVLFHFIEEAQQRAEIAEKERLENEKRLAEEKLVVAKEVYNKILFFF